ncbi:murein L,D-transpeptidase catalytic domain family protein [Flavobacterium sp. ZE23DGlu08]|uniref:murein L,D-transpeptidase catalytic domain family protein n=1 Tax=Flavobacterium sp. ZE23DGlu08 TaxID=3059026 RepID=UPI0026603B6B|nr:murein L,D-transpeptidase catalytic domain family protein [Flavobacterium sp. ZE23DGlu08]WKL42929.1 murein L,D-transpeptidase catalytic domain family protein [Flavobacterium sp. ZE23DGlu08]
MIYNLFPTILFMLFSFSTSKTNLSESSDVKPVVYAKTVESSVEAKIELAYNNLHSDKFALPKLESFAEALKGYYSLKEKGLIKKDILTLIDFSLSSNTKRLWVIDLLTGDILFHSLVAHGRNTGNEFASNFSNSAESYKSSLGFYATGEIYNGKHGMSLKLDGLEKGVNDNARARGVVMHAADYVSNSFIKNNHRLGRSQGCPAVPVELSKDIISAIKNKSCFFIYHPSRASKFGTESIS